jgi:CRP-like cAMP-binding protein
MRDTKISRISELPLFQATKPPALRRLAAVTDEVTVPRGTTLVARAGVTSDFFVIEEGRGLWLSAGENLLEIGRGDVFGELPVAHGHLAECDQTVVAETDLRLLILRRQTFPLLNELVPGLSGTLAEAVALHSGF